MLCAQWQGESEVREGGLGHAHEGLVNIAHMLSLTIVLGFLSSPNAPTVGTPTYMILGIKVITCLRNPNQTLKTFKNAKADIVVVV